MSSLRENWRIILLTLLVVASLAMLFVPSLTLGSEGGGGGSAADADGTTLKYSIELAGGTRIRAPLVGTTATGVDLGNASADAVEGAVAERLEGVDPGDVNVRRTERGPAVEVTAETSPEELGAALDGLGLQYANVRPGVTEGTRQEAVRVLRSKINEAGLSGGTVRVVDSGTRRFVLIEVPDDDRSGLVELIQSRGTVRIDAYYRPDGAANYTRRTVLTQEEFAGIGIAREGQGGQGPSVPVGINESAAGEFQRAMVETGLARQGGSRCFYESRDQVEDVGTCLLVVSDGDVVGSFGMSPDLAQLMLTGQWARDPQFVLQTRNFSEAREIAINLRAGALPARLDIGEGGEGTSTSISPTQGERFRSDSLLTGIIAVLAVSGVVFVRYGDVRVALPMVVTALSEVLILLGFAAFIRFPLDLSVIGGFVAVIGTGVDDLIIIADEVLSEGDVNSSRVFRNRFRKALWVIGVAAGTTIIAMAPLASPFLSLGDLQGFAIFTILGVLVGVIITRPAYGDILRGLLTDR